MDCGARTAVNHTTTTPKHQPTTHRKASTMPSLQQQLENAITGQTPLVYVLSPEEQRILDYKKIIHNCQERIRQLKYHIK